MVKKTVDVVVIGAGLTGLVTAYYLQKNGKRVAVVEKSEHLGGVIQSGKEAGFLYEKGPNTGVLASTESVELFDELKDLCTVEKADPEAEKRLIWKGGKWEAIPSGLLDAITTSLFTTKDKLRILGEPFRQKGDDPFENIADLVKRRLGQSYLEYAVDPFLSGIYAGDPEYLVTKYAMPKLYNLEQDYGSFIKGAIQKKKLPKTALEKRADRSVFTVKGGLHNLIQALAAKIQSDHIFTSMLQVEVKPTTNGYSLHGSREGELYEINSKEVVSTVNAIGVKDIFPFLPSNAVHQIYNLVYAKMTQVILGFNKWEGMDIKAFGGLVPSKEQRDILGVLFTSSFFPNRAPKGGALLSVFAGGTKRPEIFEKSDNDLMKMIRAELANMMGADLDGANLVRIFRYPAAIAQYGRSTKERLEAIAEIEKKNKGLILAGNIRDGIGMTDRIRQGRMVADQLAAYSY